MKNILFGYIMDGKAGGIDKYMLNFFDRFSPDEVHFDFLTTEIDPQLLKRLNEKGAGLYEIPSLKNPVAQYKAIKEIILKNKYDTAYFNISTSICFTGPKAAKKCGVKKVIIHSHSSGYDCLNDKKRAIMVKFNSLCRKFLYKYGTDFYACSSLAGKWMFPEKIVESDKFKVIKNAVDVSKFGFSPEKRDKMRKELGLEGKFVVGNVGNFVYQKNHLFLIDCFAKLCKINQNAVLLLLGDGPLMDMVKQKVNSLGISDKVIFTGRKTNANDYFQAMDVFTLPSNFEGLGIVAIEAQASGLKCFFSDNIPQEAILTDNCLLLPINNDDNAERWAKEINCVGEYERTDKTDVISNQGFSLENQIYDVLV